MACKGRTADVLNSGKVLMAQIWAPPCRTSALQLLLQDLAGWVVPVSIFHASETLESQCRIGVKLREFHFVLSI